MKRSILPGMILGLLLGLPLSVAASTVVPQGKENAALIPEDQLLYSLPKTETGDYILRCVDRHGPKSVLRTAYFLTPPYAIHALCRTTATNVRFTLLDGELIFNWEGNPRDLRLDLPIRPPRNGVADGKLGDVGPQLGVLDGTDDLIHGNISSPQGRSYPVLRVQTEDRPTNSYIIPQTLAPDKQTQCKIRENGCAL